MLFILCFIWYFVLLHVTLCLVVENIWVCYVWVVLCQNKTKKKHTFWGMANVCKITYGCWQNKSHHHVHPVAVLELSIASHDLQQTQLLSFKCLHFHDRLANSICRWWSCDTIKSSKTATKWTLWWDCFVNYLSDVWNKRLSWSDSTERQSIIWIIASFSLIQGELLNYWRKLKMSAARSGTTLSPVCTCPQTCLVIPSKYWAAVCSNLL